MGDDKPFRHKHVTGETDPNKIKAEYDRIQRDEQIRRQAVLDRLRTG